MQLKLPGLDRIGVVTPALWLIAGLAIVGVAVAGNHLSDVNTANRTIKDLLSHKDIKIDKKSALPDEVLARVNESLWRDRIDDAQALAMGAQTVMPAQKRAAILYNMANWRTRQAIGLVSKGDIDKAAALINLAKSEYRLSLRLDPDHWDAKYNLDVAMRIVRDLPQAENLQEQDGTPKKIWTDLPGVPKGLP